MQRKNTISALITLIILSGGGRQLKLIVLPVQEAQQLMITPLQLDLTRKLDMVTVVVQKAL